MRRQSGPPPWDPLMRLSARLLLLLLLAAVTLGAQAQYKWTDHDGTVSYGDQPGKDAEHVERIGAISGPADVNSDALARLPFEIRKAAHDFPVVLYARADCAPCDEARAFLKSRNIPYSERLINSSEDINAFHKQGGTNLLPSVNVGRQMLRGFEAGSWSEALASAGYPRDLPLPRDWQWAVATPLAPPPPPPPSADGSSPDGTDTR
jgi:glutaredoxin